MENRVEFITRGSARNMPGDEESLPSFVAMGRFPLRKLMTSQKVVIPAQAGIQNLST